MSPDELPLLDLFNHMREHGLPLGIDDYMLALRALQAGFGVQDRQSLEQLCCILWTKSDDEARLFHRLFDQLLAQSIATHVETALTKTLQSPEILDKRPEQSQAEMQQPESRKPSEALPSPSPQISLSESYQPAPSEAIKPTVLSLTLEMGEPIQVVQAIRCGASSDWKMGRSRFNLLTEYFPVTRRQMKQSWRYLRRPVREGPPEELDIAATVEKIGREGILREPVLVPVRSNRARLILLIDRDGSMVPFHALSRQLAETSRRGGRLEQAGLYYFHDYPDGYLYRDPARLQALPIPDALAAIGKQAAVLIVSDAGAARGNRDAERVKHTQEFIQQLKQSVRYYAWLNPMPNTRWPGTTAGEIAHLAPMFEMNRHGLDAAISTLRGRYTYWEKMYPWMM